MVETLWYSLAEVSKATRIPRGRLDHACRVGRLPYRRSETGARLLPQSVVEKLKKQGLAAFPRPYDPVALAPSEEGAPKQADRPTAADRIGLLAEPSAEIVKAKERAEAAKLKVEQESAQLELLRIQQDQERARRATAAERRAEMERERAEREAEAEWRREEAEAQAEAQRQATAAQRERERRERHMRWLKEQLSRALSEAGFELLRYVPQEKRSQAEEGIAAALVRDMERLTADSPRSACERARQLASERVLAPFKAAKAIEEALEEIPRYMERLYEEGYVSSPTEDRQFLAKRLRPGIQAELQRQAEARAYRLSEEEARQLVRDAVDRNLRLA